MAEAKPSMFQQLSHTVTLGSEVQHSLHTFNKPSLSFATGIIGKTWEPLPA